MLEVESLNVYYGDIQVLWDVSLKVDRGEIVALIGSNGAGKTTLLKTIAGLLKPASGSINYLNERIDKLPPHKIVERGVALVPEGRGLFPHMTVYENLLMGAYTQRENSREVLNWVYEIFPILKERSRQLASTLSGGEQQMLAIARSLMSNPKLLMLDEPSQGLGPKVVIRILDTVKMINERGVTIMLVEQSAPFALELADRVYVIENGRIVHSGRSEEIRSLEDVKKAYLGL
jgi:branched-chain amino acid transport system ATP-binding protein